MHSTESPKETVGSEVVKIICDIADKPEGSFNLNSLFSETIGIVLVQMGVLSSIEQKFSEEGVDLDIDKLCRDNTLTIQGLIDHIIEQIS